MINKKYIMITALVMALTVGVTAVQADNSNNLLRMDVNKSSATNTVDVTFYTTEDMGNSVVTRKGNNRYVVLLPNVQGSSTATPGIGGVKDLITNVDVKTVDDGIGGYTKVTFETTKPVNIKTYIKKTNPLTQAQKDSQALLAKNNAQQQPKTEPPKTQTTTTKPTTTQQNKPVTTAVKPATKPAETTQNKNVSTQTKQPMDTKQTQPVAQPKTEPIKVAAETSKVQTKPQVNNSIPSSNDNYVPKMRLDTNGKRQIDLEPRIVHEITTNRPIANEKSITNENENINATYKTGVNMPIATNKTTSKKSSKHTSIWSIILGILTLGGSMLFLLFDAITNKSKEKDDKHKSFFNTTSKNQIKIRKREYQEIIEDGTLSWQERYKKYTEKEQQLNPINPENSISFVTDMSATKKAIIIPEADEVINTQKEETTVKQEKLPTALDLKQAKESIKNIPSRRSDELTNKIRAKISQMEHALAQTPTNNEPEEINNEVRSEDKAITEKMNDIKLKSFSKPVSLRETLRTLANDKKQSRNKSYKEGRFVKLKNSPLSVNRRKSASSDLNAQDLLHTVNKYLTNNGEIKMDKQHENYMLSSLNEYISILDSEDKAKTETNTTVVQALAKVKPSSDIMSRSGISNPISRTTNPMRAQNSAQYINGLVVKSGYNIDAERGFYLVNMDGVTALVGRANDNVFILKKFDHIIDQPIQVRKDYGSVYIVRAGGFKCLVDVSKEKMGTLIEI